ncbi:hypothetical protein [Pajaroellobacter abortibovis]|uniref:Quinol:cytochrome C oxidoreductase n=1 Tax=Pajaroellobacter abortibovis TaxID=1882918 RepID=A0A1L6MVA1_9BACT|nr:hypothetical protein [Pajaroellobacter abortibovis]APR99443.1 hypothetical protein BCY86_01160 [Pajaroellobacter abortibovis]
MNSSHHAVDALTPDSYRIAPDHTWSKVWKIAAGIAGVGGMSAAFGLVTYTKRFMYSYLFALYSVLTLALGALFFVVIQHLTKAYWSVTVRRTAEFFAYGLRVFIILALPLLLVAAPLYPWLSHSSSEEHENSHVLEEDAHPGLSQGDEVLAGEESAFHGHSALSKAYEEEHAHVLAKKLPYLNYPFFLVRAALYLLAWAWLGIRFFKLSVQQDQTKQFAPTVAAQKLAPPATVLFGITLTFAGIDWLMSLEPMWYSTMWGVYIFAGSVVSSLAVVILTLLLLRKANLLGSAVTVEHFHDLGKLQFGFLVFWAYIAFSQFFLIWYSNLPEEVVFFHARWDAAQGSWKNISWAIVLGHFVIPFALLLSRSTKRKLSVLGLGAVVILVMHWLELYWIVLPHYGLGALAPHWLDLACFAAVAGAYFAVVFHAMTNYSLIPTGDPRLERALHHRV